VTHITYRCGAGHLGRVKLRHSKRLYNSNARGKCLKNSTVPRETFNKFRFETKSVSVSRSVLPYRHFPRK